MKIHEAEQLAQKILQTWPRTAGSVDIWVEDIMELDAGAANTAYVRLRREQNNAPTIADFRRAVRSMTTTDGGNADKCSECSDSGWIEGPCYAEHGQPYTSAMPCPMCKYGERAFTSKVWQERPHRKLISSKEAEAMRPKQTFRGGAA